MSSSSCGVVVPSDHATSLPSVLETYEFLGRPASLKEREKYFAADGHSAAWPGAIAVDRCSVPEWVNEAIPLEVNPAVFADDAGHLMIGYRIGAEVCTLAPADPNARKSPLGLAREVADRLDEQASRKGVGSALDSATSLISELCSICTDPSAQSAIQRWLGMS